MSSYAPLPTSELDADVNNHEVPPNVLEAAHRMFALQHQRSATSDAEALAFVEQLVAAKRRSEQAQASASCATGVPADVLAASVRIFEAHHGRRPGSTAEAMSFASALATEQATGGAAAAPRLEEPSAPSSSDDVLPDDIPPHVAAAALAVYERHVGRPASSAVEAISFASGIVSASQTASEQIAAASAAAAAAARSGSTSDSEDFDAPPQSCCHRFALWFLELMSSRRVQPARTVDRVVNERSL